MFFSLFAQSKEPKERHPCFLSAFRRIPGVYAPLRGTPPKLPGSKKLARLQRAQTAFDPFSAASPVLGGEPMGENLLIQRLRTFYGIGTTSLYFIENSLSISQG